MVDYLGRILPFVLIGIHGSTVLVLAVQTPWAMVFLVLHALALAWSFELAQVAEDDERTDVRWGHHPLWPAAFGVACVGALMVMPWVWAPFLVLAALFYVDIAAHRCTQVPPLFD